MNIDVAKSDHCDTGLIVAMNPKIDSAEVEETNGSSARPFWQKFAAILPDEQKALFFVKRLLPMVDVFVAPFVYPAAFLLKLIRMAGVHRLPRSKKALLQVGVFPVRNHYFEPLFDSRHLRHHLRQNRSLPGISWNVAEQLDLLKRCRFQTELESMPASKNGDLAFDFDNVAFGGGDADFLYNMIRLKKPARIFEIGSGHSTLMAIEAIDRNKKENPGYSCKHLCIEPYEQPWLERAGVIVVRQRVEELDVAFFSELEKDDLLFIDSSHVIRPQGDVLFEYLELLSSLKTGVVVHIHDIFSPGDYPEVWIKDEVRLWNEQYLLEAFLTGNRDWKIIGALNCLHHNHFEALRAACPYLTADCEPGSFYMQKIA
jgi:hypothetical protein